MIIDIVQAVLLAGGALFFLIGALGLLRFPDVYTRIHALTKVDNLGLGLVVLALLLTVDSVAVAAKLLLIWFLALVASATAAHLLARAARRNRVAVWQREDNDTGGSER